MMGRPNKLLAALSARVRLDDSREFASDIFEPSEPLSPEEELEARRSELRQTCLATNPGRLILVGDFSADVKYVFVIFFVRPRKHGTSKSICTGERRRRKAAHGPPTCAGFAISASP
jgi:hypothetical protein